MPQQAEQSGDDAAVERVLAGQRDAFEALVRRHEDFVFRLVRRHVPAADAEDAAQEAFLRAYRALPAYRGGAFRPWLASIVVRTCHDHWRRVYRTRETPMSRLTPEHEKWLESALARSSLQALEDQGAADEAREVLSAGLDRLPPDDRMVLELVYLEGLSGREAAALLGWSPAKVKVRCFRARRRLEGFLLKTARVWGK